MLQGFRHGVDKIDLSQTGLSRFDELQISKVKRLEVYGTALIHGVSVDTSTLSGSPGPVKLLYLDALEVAQVTAEDFIFAAPAVVTPDDTAFQEPSLMQMQASIASPDQPSGATDKAYSHQASQALPNLANLVDAMAAFAPQATSSSQFGDIPRPHWDSTVAVAA